MHEFGILKDLVIILGASVIIVAIFRKLKLPPIAGFILAGVLVGPQALGLISNSHDIEVLAEIGVALLLFSIGLELALSKLRRLWKLALIGGFLQVSVTIAVAFVISSALGLSTNSSILIGCIIALSSTAIVLKGLQQRGEIDAPHGRLTLGILVFQDFSVVPIMLIIPILIGSSMETGEIALTFLKSFGIVAVVLLLSVLVVPRILKMIAQTKQRQLFILSVFVICIGVAWAVTKSGASLAIGAFLAGLVVAGSEYRHQAMADMISFREIFASLFFVSIGMLLSPASVLKFAFPILAILTAILLGKAIIVFLAALAMKLPLRASIITGFTLAQIGEFSFVLLYAVKGSGLIDNDIENILVTAAILSMFLTPFVMSFGPRLAVGLGKFKKLKNILQVDSAEDASDAVCKLCDHIIIAGYGFAGRELALSLDKNNIPYIIVDINIDNIRFAVKEKQNAVYGDVTSDAVLEQLGIETAKELAVLINDAGASEHAVRVARSLAPELFISVRTQYLLDIEPLINAGANEVIPAEREAAVRIVSQTLGRYKINDADISDEEATIRDHSED